MYWTLPYSPRPPPDTFKLVQLGRHVANIMKHVRLASYWNDLLFVSIFRRHPGFPGYSPPGYMPRYRRNLSPTPGYLSGNVHRHRNKSGGVGGLLPSYWYPRWAPSETGSRGSTRRGWETASEGTGDRGWETDPGEHGDTSGKRPGRGAGRKERRRRRNSTGSYPGSTNSGGRGKGAPRRWHWRTSAGGRFRLRVRRVAHWTGTRPTCSEQTPSTATSPQGSDRDLRPPPYQNQTPPTATSLPESDRDPSPSPYQNQAPTAANPPQGSDGNLGPESVQP